MIKSSTQTVCLQRWECVGSLDGFFEKNEEKWFIGVYNTYMNTYTKTIRERRSNKSKDFYKVKS